MERKSKGYLVCKITNSLICKIMLRYLPIEICLYNIEILLCSNFVYCVSFRNVLICMLM